MKIKRALKRSPSTVPGIAHLVVQLTTVQQDELPALLLPVIAAGWSWPRTDLQHWIAPLNRFDVILEDVVRDYDLATMEHGQRNAFTPRTKELLTAILGFEKLLLENSTNRKIFASFDRLNDLLHTTDDSVLLATLRLGLRPAQQFSTSNQNGAVAFGISEKRLLNLAQGWGTRDVGLEMVDLAGDSIQLPPELDEVEWQFYRRAAVPGKSGGESMGRKDKGKDVDAMEVEGEAIIDSPAPPTRFGLATPSSAQSPPAAGTYTPSRSRASFAPNSLLATPIPTTPLAAPTSAPTSPPSEGLTTVQLGNVRNSLQDPIDILVDAVETYDIPESDRLNLLQKIRIAKALDSTTERHQMLIVRLLAIALLAHSTSESQVQTKLFLYEPELIPQLAELVHPDRKVPVEIQTAAFYALDALAKMKSKTSEVASALNASVSHGILMYVLRKTATDLEGDSPTTTPEFIDAIFNLLTFFQTSSFVGNMIVGAGITSTLVDFVKNQRRDRVAVVTKAITFLDSLMYGYSSAFNLFVTIGGLAVFVERIKDEVELCVEAHGSIASTSQTIIDNPTGLLSFDQAALLKGLLRAIQRLMQTAGTTEGLRNLIDTSLLSSVKSILQNRDVFGPQIFGLAINITATFVHNEPTCLTTIQEANIPEVLYDAMEESIPASIDVFQALPNVIGALLLNPAGLAQFNTRSLISRYFSIFSSERHVRILQERDNATMVGASIDELIRHHPSLKDKVLESVMVALRDIREMGRSFVPESNDGFNLEVVSPFKPTDQPPSTSPSEGSPEIALTPDVVMQDASPAPKAEEFKENNVMMCVDVIGRFLEGLFQNLAHCKDFVRLDPFSTILDIFALPCAPHTTPNTPAFVSISTLFRIMSEVKPTEVVTAVLKQVRTYLALTKPLWSSFSIESRLAPLLSPTEDTLAECNRQFRDFSYLLTYIALLFDIYSNLVYSHGKVATLLLSALATPTESQTLSDLGEVYRVCLWENIILKKTSSTSLVDEDAVPTPFESSSIANNAAPTNPEASTSATAVSGVESPVPTSSPNSKAVQEVVAMIPQNISPFLQAASKMFVHRRSSDSVHRKSTSEVAKSIATVMKASVEWPNSSNLSNNLAYSTLMISFVSGLLFDERASSAGIQTMLLVAFEKVGGLQAFLRLYERYQGLASDLVSTSDDNSKVEVGLPVVHVFSGLKIALDLLLRLSSQRSLLEAPQTGLLLGREKDKSSAQYFEPHDFLVALRAVILPAVSTTWEMPWLVKSPPTVVRNLVGTLVNILRAEGETATDPAGTTTAGSGISSLPFGLGSLTTGAPGGGATAAPDENRITQLTDMGFPRTAARTALTRCRNNVAIAAEYLLQHPDIVGAARLAEQEEGPAVNEDEPAAASIGEGENVASAADVQAPPATTDMTGTPAIGVSPGEEDADVIDESTTPAAAPQLQDAAQDVEMQDENATERIKSASTPSIPVSREILVKQTKASLDDARTQLKPKFLEKSLHLAEEYPELVFDIKGAFTDLYPTGDKASPSLDPLLENLAEIERQDSNEQAVATRLRLIALLAADATFREAIEPSREKLMEVVMRYQRLYMALMPSIDARPKWLPPVTLVVDSLFSLAEVPRPIEILQEGAEDPSVELVAQGPAWQSERAAFFELAMDMLEKGASERDSFISCLRLLLVLTRDHALAVQFARRGGLRTLLSALAVDRPETTGCHPFVSMLIRHIVEDDATLQPLMVREIESWFSHQRNKVADVTGFLRGISSIAFRNVPAFLEAARSTCKLVRADSTTHYHIALQNEPQPPTKPTEAESAIKSPISEEVPSTSVELAMDDTAFKHGKSPANPSVAASPPSPTTEVVIHLLMAEALDASKIVFALAMEPSLQAGEKPESRPAAVVSDVPQLPVDTSVLAEEGGADAAVIEPGTNEFAQLSYLLSCLAELLSSYSTCKTSFLAFSTRRSPKESVLPTSTAPKSKSSFLYFLLNDLIPVNSVVNPSDFQGKRKSALSLWASLLIVSLCSDPDATVSSKDSAAEITHIRKGVLDAISRAFKEATSSSESTDVRYGRLFALSDLCYRLLTARPYAHVAKANDETSMQMAKLMLEKNFAVTLTNALADVDLNFPSVNNLINSILRPLEQLTKVVTKVGRSKSSSLPPARGLGGDISSSDSSMDEDSDDESEEEEEEAPDLYRNSALGIYEGELEPAAEEWEGYSDGSGSEEDPDELMEELGDEGLVPGSDVSDVSEDEEPVFIDDDDAEMMEEMNTDSDGSSHPSDDDLENSDDDSEDELEMHDQAQNDLLNAQGGEEGDWVDEHEDEDEDEEIGVGNGNDAPGGAFEGPTGGLQDGDGDESEDSYDEEEMLLTGELEFDADEEQFGGISDGAVASGWNSAGGEGALGRRNRNLEEMMMADAAIFGNRSRAPQVPATPAHPLLVDSSSSDNQLNSASSRRRRAPGQGTAEYNAWAQHIEQLLGPGSVEALQDLLGSYGLEHLAGPDQLRLQIGPGPDGRLAMLIDRNPQAPPVAGGAPTSRARTSTQPNVPRSSRHASERITMSQFLPVTTSQRWQEESRVEAGSVLVAERIARTVNHLINILHPAARLATQLAAKVQREKEAEELVLQEKAEAEGKEKKAREEDEETAETLASGVVSGGMLVESSNGDSVEPQSDSAAVQERSDGSDDAMEGVTMQGDIAEVIRLANSLATGLGAPSTMAPTPASDPETLPSSSAPEIEPEPVSDEATGLEASSSTATARVMITIDGEEFDITDTGIDPTFLEALPDEMRQEVLNQHFRESRSAGPPPPAVPSQINSEFLDALPPDLRAEVLRQEAADQRREQATARAAATRSSGNTAPGGAAEAVDLDPATFFATLDPDLREAVLLEQEEGFLSTLPANLLAEANNLRQASARRRISRLPQNPHTPGGAGAPQSTAVPKKAPVHREAIQLLEKSGLATLVRLLFFPQPLRKNALQKVLVNLCENSRTRMDLINLLLTILQDGTRDVSAVDKSFSQMSLRASKSLGNKDTPRRKGCLETPGGALPHFPGESVPNLIAQRCLEALMFLVASNEQSPLFFLTEQEVPVGLSRRQSKKGKGKEKATPSVTFPLVILLGLLDRPALLKTPSMMDSLSQLLSGITKVLSVLQKRPENAITSTSTTIDSSESAPPPATASPGDELPAVAIPGTLTDTPTNEPKEAKDVVTSETLVQHPPQIPPAVLRLVVNVLDAGECSSKTFQQTLVLIQNLSYLPGARDIILDELKSRAQSLSNALLPDLDELLFAIEGAKDVRGLTLANFSPAASLQAKLLRILKTIDHSPPKKASSAELVPAGSKKLTEEEEKVMEIYDGFAFGELWERLGTCLGAAELDSELSYIGNVLLPLIEAVMVVSKFIGRRPLPKDAQSPAPMSPSATRDANPSSTEAMFLKFTEDHRRTINQLVRSNPGLMSGSFAVLAKNSSILDFDTKRNFFFSRLHDRSLRQRNHYGTLQINVRRQYVFEDSFHVLQRRTGDEIKHGKLSVKFYDEEGVDAGGVTREWFSVLARQMFNPGYALFQPQAADALTYQPNKSSSINDEHLAFFQFVGRIIGKALHDQRILEAYFSRAMYKHMLGKPVDHRDLESIDPEYHKSLVWMLENDIDGILDLTFSVERDDFGVSEIVDLIHDGRNVAVTNENKAEYVRLIADQRLSIEIKEQMDAMLKGLYEIVPKDLLQIFSEQELELLISGLPDIDVDEWRANTELHNFTPSHPVIGYFWRAVRSFTMEERAKLLQFVSGSSRVPLEGFGALQGMSGVTKFSITSAGDTLALPTAHTCFNQLDLPSSYESYEALRKALLTAIHEGGESFGFA